MTDYWKSTPKFLCKYCDDFVKDTKFERQRHDASARHQGAVARHLRTVQKKGDQEERDKKRAQAEIARLNKLVGGPSTIASAPKASPKPPVSQSDLPWKKQAHTFNHQDERQVTQEDRRRHAEQLAALGVDIPQEYRDDIAEPGTWQTVSVRNLNEDGGVISEKKRDEEAPEARAVGVRSTEEEREDPAEREAVSFKLRKTGTGDGNKRKRDRKLDSSDLDALFGGMGKKVKTEVQTEVKTEVKAEDGSTIKNEDEDETEQRPAVRSGFSLTIKKREAPAVKRDIPPILLKRRQQTENTGTTSSGKPGADASRFLG
jgi:U1 zinc finger